MWMKARGLLFWAERNVIRRAGYWLISRATINIWCRQIFTQPELFHPIADFAVNVSEARVWSTEIAQKWMGLSLALMWHCEQSSIFPVQAFLILTCSWQTFLFYTLHPIKNLLYTVQICPLKHNTKMLLLHFNHKQEKSALISSPDI
jgi:hypothetical protein